MTVPYRPCSGEGCGSRDVEGKEYLDSWRASAYAPRPLPPQSGASHPRPGWVAAAMSPTFTYLTANSAGRAAGKTFFADRVFFCNSGTEANEAGDKLARKYSADHFGAGRYEIISLTSLSRPDLGLWPPPVRINFTKD